MLREKWNIVGKIDKKKFFHLSSLTHWNFRRKHAYCLYHLLRWKLWWITSEFLIMRCLGKSSLWLPFIIYLRDIWFLWLCTVEHWVTGCSYSSFQLPSFQYSEYFRKRNNLWGKMNIWFREHNPTMLPDRAGAWARGWSGTVYQMTGMKGRISYFVTRIKCYFYMQQTHLVELKISSFLLCGKYA